jgi:hypothetical protein
LCSIPSSSKPRPMRIFVASCRSSSSFMGVSEAGGIGGSMPKSKWLWRSAFGCEPGCLASTLSLCLARMIVRQWNPLRCDSCIGCVMFLGPPERCASSQSERLLSGMGMQSTVPLRSLEKG